MPHSWMGLVELALVFGLVLAFAVWELVKLRRDQRAAEAASALAREREARTPAAPTPSNGAPPGAPPGEPQDPR